MGRFLLTPSGGSGEWKQVANTTSSNKAKVEFDKYKEILVIPNRRHNSTYHWVLSATLPVDYIKATTASDYLLVQLGGYKQISCQICIDYYGGQIWVNSMSDSSGTDVTSQAKMTVYAR